MKKYIREILFKNWKLLFENIHRTPLRVKFFISILFFFFFLIFEYENPFNPNYYSCYLSCCCSCMINILGRERFGCLTNSDTMEVESFFFFFLFNRKIVGEGGGGVQTMDIPNWSLLYWKEMIQIITSKFPSILFFFLFLILCLLTKKFLM